MNSIDEEYFGALEKNHNTSDAGKLFPGGYKQGENDLNAVDEQYFSDMRPLDLKVQVGVGWNESISYTPRSIAIVAGNVKNGLFSFGHG